LAKSGFYFQLFDQFSHFAVLLGLLLPRRSLQRVINLHQTQRTKTFLQLNQHIHEFDDNNPRNNKCGFEWFGGVLFLRKKGSLIVGGHLEGMVVHKGQAFDRNLQVNHHNS
jgi:hypothetical protein